MPRVRKHQKKFVSEKEVEKAMQPRKKRKGSMRDEASRYAVITHFQQPGVGGSLTHEDRIKELRERGLHEYYCNKCGHTWVSPARLIRPECPKCD